MKPWCSKSHLDAVHLEIQVYGSTQMIKKERNFRLKIFGGNVTALIALV